MHLIQRLAPLPLGLLVACSQSSVIEATAQVPSPSGAYVATVETLDNGLGFGLGRLIEEVHVGSKQTSTARHGGEEPTVVFWVDASEATAAPTDVRWVSDEVLEICYDKSQHPGKMRPSVGEVTLTYRVRG